MRNLIEFFLRNGVVLAFLGLEFLCFYLIIQFNQRQSESFHSATAAITGSLNKRVSGIADYMDLDAQNDSLRLENARLRKQLYSQRTQHTTALEPPVVDSSGIDSMGPLYEVLPAAVIQNSITRRNNYITLDIGREDGVENGLGVISEIGPIGVIIGVSKHYSRLISILHSNSMISAAILGKGYFGSLVWRGTSHTRMQLEAIPKHAQIFVGDTVATSGYSQLFPPDVLIGTIDTFYLPRGSNFYRIEVELFQDMARLQYAYVLKSNFVNELRELQNPPGDEE